MNSYLNNFFEHSGQLMALASVTVLWLGLNFLGAFVGGPNRLREATPFYGWAIVSFVFTIGGVFTTLQFSTMTIGLVILALILGTLAYRRDGSLLPPGFYRIVILSLPLLILVSAMVGSQWDEFSDWLFTPRQLLENNAFPDRSNKHLSGALSSYPFNWHFITFLASRLSGHLEESAGALVNILLLLSFGLHLIGLIEKKSNNNASLNRPSWGLCALGALLTTVLNPTFAQKVVLTSYADVSTAVAVGFAVTLGWKMLNAFSEERKGDARALAWQMSLLLVVLINLKQATLILFALLICATLITGLRDPKIKFRDVLRQLPIIIIPPLIIYLAWRYHVTFELDGREFSIRPFSDWYIAEIPEILQRMLLVFSKKGLYFAIFLIVIFFSIHRFFYVRTPFDRLAVMVGIVMIGYNVFLLFSYVAAFGKADALRAASFWRYNMHLGPVAILFYFYGLVRLFNHFQLNFSKQVFLARVAVILIIIAPFVFAEKIRFDKVKHVYFYRSVGAELNKFLKEGDTLVVIDPRGSGESAAVTRFQLSRRDIIKSYLSMYQKPNLKIFMNIFQSNDFSHALIHSVSDDLQQGLGQELHEDNSYLLERDGETWREIKRWPTPKGFLIH